jgi:hypothetical protein
MTEREAWLAWMISTDRHHPDCYLDSQQEELFAAWMARSQASVVPYGPDIPVEHWSQLTQRIDDVLEQYASPSHVLQLLRDLRTHVAARVQAKVDANLARYMPHTAKKLTDDDLAD